DRGDTAPEGGPGVARLPQPPFRALIERPPPPCIEAGAPHQEERLAVGLRAGDSGNGALKQRTGDGCRGAPQADLVGEHIASADGNNAEADIPTDEARGRVADGTIATGGDDGVEGSPPRRLAPRDAGRRGVPVAAAHERRAGLAEKAHNVIYERRAGDAGTGIFQDEEAAAHTRTARVNRAKPPDGIIKPAPLARRRAGGPTPPAGGFEGGVGPG